jgi:hypothetical protein
MTVPVHCRVIGRWPIVEADLWDRDYLDLAAPAAIIGSDNRGEIAFGAMQASLDLSLQPLHGLLHMGPLRRDGRGQGDRCAERLDDGSLGHLHLSQRRRGHPQGQPRAFFNSLLGLLTNLLRRARFLR